MYAILCLCNYSRTLDGNSPADLVQNCTFKVQLHTHILLVPSFSAVLKMQQRTGQDSHCRQHSLVAVHCVTRKVRRHQHMEKVTDRSPFNVAWTPSWQSKLTSSGQLLSDSPCLHWKHRLSSRVLTVRRTFMTFVKVWVVTVNIKHQQRYRQTTVITTAQKTCLSLQYSLINPKIDFIYYFSQRR